MWTDALLPVPFQPAPQCRSLPQARCLPALACSSLVVSLMQTLPEVTLAVSQAVCSSSEACRYGEHGEGPAGRLELRRGTSRASRLTADACVRTWGRQGVWGLRTEGLSRKFHLDRDVFSLLMFTGKRKTSAPVRGDGLCSGFRSPILLRPDVIGNGAY